MVEDAGLWLDEVRPPDLRFSPVEGPDDVDVAVIGGGITGLSTACHLKARAPSLDVVVLERDRVGFGASGRSSGALTAIPDRRFAAKLERDGEAEARRAVAFQRQGVETALRLVDEGAIDCGLRRPGYLILGQSRHVPALHREASAMQALEVEGAFLDRDEVRARLRQDYYDAGVSGPAHWINPARYVAGLARLAVVRGARIHERSPVTKVRKRRTIELQLRDGGRVRAATVVLATNGYTSRLGFLRRRVYPVRTGAIATEPLTASQLEALRWEGREVVFEASRTGHTFLRTPDDRLFCRGMLQYRLGDGLRPIPPADLQATLTAAVHERFPELGHVAVAHRWSGVLGMTRSFRPAIGRLGRDGRVLYAAGYSGHGLAYASLAGRLLAELHSGDNSPELAYALEHPLPPAMPLEPFRYLAFHGATRWLRSRGGP